MVDGKTFCKLSPGIYTHTTVCTSMPEYAPKERKMGWRDGSAYKVLPALPEDLG